MRRVVAAVAVLLAAAGCGAPYNAGDYADDDIAAGQAFMAQGDFRRAIERFEAAVANEPGYAPGYLMRGQAKRAMGWFGEAVDDFSEAMARGLGNSAYVYVVRADTLVAGGEIARALADYEHALALKPDYWPARLGRGVALAESADSERALADLDHVLAHDPGSIKEVLATMPVQMLSPKGPSAHGTKTVTISFPTQSMVAAAYLARGKLHFDRGDYGPALADLEQALDRRPDLDAARLYRGLAFFGLGQCLEGRVQLQMMREEAKPATAAALQRHSSIVDAAGCAADLP